MAGCSGGSTSPTAYSPATHSRIPLPSVPDELPAHPVDRGVYRCVKVSAGRLRHVQIHGSFNAPVVTMWALADLAAAGDWVRERSVSLADVWADQSYLNTTLPQRIPALALLHPTDPDKVYFFLQSCIFAVDLRLGKVVEFNDFWMPEPPPHLKRSSHFVHVWQNDPSERPDILPSCFNRDKFSIGPDVKKLMKRFAAAKSRSTAVTVKPVVHKGISLKRTWDQANIEMEQLQAKKMKLRAVFSEAMEYVKNLPASSRIKEVHDVDSWFDVDRISPFACSYQPEPVSHETVFFSHNKSAIQTSTSQETNQRTG